jgi:dinuclear metal center YbgI/SA1388 family protein
MKLKEIIAPLEAFAPLALQESYDNAGLITGNPGTEVTGAVLCLDATEEVLDEALRLGVNLVISHHPIVFRPIKSLAGADNVDRVVIKAIKNDMAIYAAHTNLDRAARGMSYVLAGKLGLNSIEVLDTMGAGDGSGFGAVGELPEPMDAMEFLRMVRSTLDIGCIRHSAPPREKVRRVALIAGSGGDGLEKAIEAGADVFLTADVRYDRFLAAERRILLADIGHFESEICAIELMHDVISKIFPTFALHKSKSGHNPVGYLTGR